MNPHNGRGEGNRMKKVTLIFGSCLLADDYMRKNKLAKGDRYKYVSSYKDICGYKNCDIIMVFESWRKPDREEVDEYCKSHNIKQRFVG